jgi:UDP-glucose 4-epimerase
MNFLITGAAGFLGSSLANHLAREGHQVRGLDDISTGDPQALAPDVHFTRGDVSDRPKLWTLLQDVDVVYHLAARVSVQESILYPRDYNAVNVGGTVALMEAMRDVGVKRVVLASSGAVYGDLGDSTLTETATPNPRSPYAVSKLAAEYYVRTIGGLWGIKPSVCVSSTRMDRVNTCRPLIHPLCRIIFARPCAGGHWSLTAMEHKPVITFMWTM